MAIKLAKRIPKIKRCISNGSQSNNIKTEHRMWQIFFVFITNIPVAPHRPMLLYSPAFFPYIYSLFGKTNENTFRSNIHQYHILYRSFVITFYLFILWGSRTQCARVYAKRQMDLFTQASHDVYSVSRIAINAKKVTNQRTECLHLFWLARLADKVQGDTDTTQFLSQMKSYVFSISSLSLPLVLLIRSTEFNIFTRDSFAYQRHTMLYSL